MASQATKKELREETLHYHHPEGSEEEVDREWEEFTRLMAKLKENRRNRPHRYSSRFSLSNLASKGRDTLFLL